MQGEPTSGTCWHRDWPGVEVLRQRSPAALHDSPLVESHT